MPEASVGLAVEAAPGRAAAVVAVLVVAACLASGVAPGVDLVFSAASALSKYLSNAALALVGGPNGVFFSPPRSLLTDLNKKDKINNEKDLIFFAGIYSAT